VTTQIDPEHAAFIQGPVSVIAASRDAAATPHLVRGLGCRLCEQRRRVTIFLAASQAQAVLADLRANGTIAVVFSQPSTHRTVQLKGDDASIGVASASDLAAVAAYQDMMVGELRSWDFPESFTRSLLAFIPDDVLTVTFTISAAFSQTPGPKAGAPLETRP